jgi:hypothetical protein
MLETAAGLFYSFLAPFVNPGDRQNHKTIGSPKIH